MSESNDLFTERWHWCALAAGFLAASEGRLAERAYVKALAYEFYESGAFRDRVTPREKGPE